MLFICIPVHNEASTIGVLLWRIRKSLKDFDREYEILVHNDGSEDATAETLAPYAEVLPLTVFGSGPRVGHAAALETLIREAVARTSYGRRDAVVTMQGDLTDRPEQLPDLIRRFEGGADVVVAQRQATSLPEMPRPVRQLRRIGDAVLRFVARTPPNLDALSGFRLYRVSVLRELIKARGAAPLARGRGWSANVDLLLGILPFARRVETLQLDPRYDLRSRPTRVRAAPATLDLLRYAWQARGRQPLPVRVRGRD
ncbi:MAG: glycosyltransferase family 2 protein [Gemmatimonadaceae bacterium]